MTHLILASKSPARRSTLEAAGVRPIILVSDVDEPAVLAALPNGRAFTGTSTTPADEVNALASAKCRSVAHALVDGLSDEALGDATQVLVVGCDSMLEMDGRMLGKPHVPDVARERIREMRNRSAVLWTGHHAVKLERSTPTESWTLLGEETAAASTVVHFGDISDEEIDAYVDSGEPLKVAGSFTVDGLGGPFITGIEGDYHSVVGLSLPLLRDMATKLLVFWPNLWDHRHT